MASIRVYGDIGDWWDGVTAEIIAQKLEAIELSDKLLEIRINSYGGFTSDGLAIYNQIRSFTAKRKAIDASFKSVAHIDGYAYSAASVIMLAADEVVMHRGSLTMIHNAWMFAGGNHNDMMKAAAYLKQVSGELAKLYAKETGIDAEKAQQLMDDETFMNGDEAKALGFADSTDDTEAGDEAKAVYASSKLQPKSSSSYREYMTAAYHRTRTSSQKTPSKSLAELMKEYDKVLEDIDEAYNKREDIAA